MICGVSSSSNYTVIGIVVVCVGVAIVCVIVVVVMFFLEIDKEINSMLSMKCCCEIGSCRFNLN